MNLTKTGKNMEGGVDLEFSPKYSTAESYTSCKTDKTQVKFSFTSAQEPKIMEMNIKNI